MMKKRILAFMLTACILLSSAAVPVGAVKEDYEAVSQGIKEVQSEYVPEQTYFVAKSAQRIPGEYTYLDGDKTQNCEVKSIQNAHGKFEGIVRSGGFAKYVFAQVFGDVPSYDYHCNPSSLSDNVTVVARYATECNRKNSLIRGEIDGTVTVENVKALIGLASVGDILVLAPVKNCNSNGTSMIITDINEAGITAYQADYTGKCAVTQNLFTFDALAEYHCLSLLHSNNYPVEEPIPPAAVSNISLSETDFALNENITANWSAVKKADGYKAYLINLDNDNTVVLDASQCVASFTFKEPGNYKIGVSAVNEYGESEISYSKKIVVHNYNYVTFVDFEGNVISKQAVEYGSNAKDPGKPQRRGYTFDSWDHELKNITEPLTISPVYEINYYNVQFCGVDGKQIGRVQSVPFGGEATPPDEYNITEQGYVFAGWQVVLDDAHQWTDYTNVEGDMKLVATQCWENENLPISITINSVVLDGKSYTIDATIKNYNTAATSFKLLATMKTSSGRTVQSTPFTQKQLQAGETRSFTGSMEYLGDANVVSVELVAVALKADDKTGGIYSKAAVCDSITNLQDWHYGAWTDWTTEKLTSSYDDYETKTQYRYNTKQYTTSTTTNNIGNGWIHYNTQSHVGSWSGWLNYSVTAQNTLALKREVETQTVPATYKTQYHYYAWVYSSGSYFTTKSAATKNAGGKTVYLNELWTDNTLTYLKTVSGIKIYKGPAGQYYNNPYWIYADGTAGGINDPTRKVVATAAYTQWKYRDTTYTYQFYKWSDYSAWQDAAVSATSEREVQTRTVYRYRNKEYGTVSGEDTLGTLYTFDGNIDNNAADLSGKTALLMVYKKTNSDPTEAQLEHVEQVTIGDNNSYSLSFKTKEEPTVDTGDFIIALGVEGASALVNIDTIKAPLPTYTVMFYDENNELIGEVQNVAKGGAAIAPDAPEKEGHTFIGWNQSFTNVQADMIINPRYEKKKYSITFIDWEKGTFELKSALEYGSVIEYPVLGDVEHTISRAWDKQLENVDIVTENMVIQTVSDFETYTVRFLISEEKIIEQQVKYGKAAELPDLSEVEEIEGKLFASWSGSCSPQYITGNVDFVPIYVYEESVKSPVAVVTENADGTCSVTLSCETEGGVIYYVIEDEDCHEATLFGMESEEAEIENIVRLMNEIQGIDDEGDEGFVGIGGYNFLSNAQIYDGEPVQLSENQTLICMASAKGMNDSIPCIEVNSSEFYVDSKNAVNSLRQYRKTIEGDFSIELTNETTSYDFGTFTLCFYDERGVMIDLIPVEAELEPGSNVISFEDVCVDFDGEAASAKLICWMAGENAKPISDAIEIEIK